MLMSQEAMRDALGALKGLLRVSAQAARDGVSMNEIANAERAARRAMAALQHELEVADVPKPSMVERRAGLPFADRRRR